MCGIVGIFNFNGRRVDDGVVQRMSDALAHRGPDAEGAFFASALGLGSRRLSIVDAPGGVQPMCTAEGNVTIVFNGEIYNHRELRADLVSRGHTFRTDSDTETILRGYAAFGADFVARLNGMFAFAIWDERTHELLLARDAFGIKPLYLHRTNQQLRFASEIKALLADPALPKRMAHNGLGYFFRYGNIGNCETAFEDVTQLPPGHYLIASQAGIVIEDYRKPCSIAPIADEYDAAARLRAAVESAVRRQGMTDVPTGVFLSGGLDSSSIVHFLSHASAEPIRTFAIGYQGSDAFYDERKHAAHVASYYGTRHEEVIITPDDAFAIPDIVTQLDEPSCDSAFLTTFLLSRCAARHVKVVLSGVGGDELFGGYHRYLGPALTGRVGKVPTRLRHALSRVLRRVPAGRNSLFLNYARLCRGFLNTHELPEFERYDQRLQIMSDSMISRVAPGLASYAFDATRSRQAIFEAEAEITDLDRIIALDTKTTLIDQLLMLTDRMTMAMGIEARVPFLDREVLEIAQRIPARMKVRGLSLRYIQKLSMDGLLPPRVLSRGKRGFGCPIGRWFRDELREMLCDVLSFSSLRRSPLLDAEAVNSLVQEHIQRKQDHSEALLSLLTFELWRRQWFD